METYFHHDPRIEEWIDQITEKIFTVCLLTGVDSEAEFQRGCQIVTKVTSLLLGLSMFPVEYLEDGLRQLVEQQLPDKRVIDNFPLFQDIMDKMLRGGISKAMDTQPKLETFNEENIIECAIPAVAIVNANANANASHNDIQGAEFEIDTEANTETESKKEGAVILDLAAITMDTSLDFEGINEDPRNDELEILEIDSIPDDILRTVQVSDQDNRLRHILNKIFPDSAVCWNLKLNDQTFVAQVEDVLIYLHDPEHPCLMENLNRGGWKVFVCSPEDLSFPRRLERGIRQILRSGKNPTIV